MDAISMTPLPQTLFLPNAQRCKKKQRKPGRDGKTAQLEEAKKERRKVADPIVR